ncbi:hypothetical protein [Thalassotalea euphylliae]|uniref:Uncharacterized protein n=1 Tax=Thalassotalea euphylliae TaxID=1655234 RepID=A0A3E0UD73_9GAMM|nr:hypothetical protein [Thalassotalea euphylliae]REL34971.1 hypothetical protein DXX92_06090 [Thalassotalea euphylliae]
MNSSITGQSYHIQPTRTVSKVNELAQFTAKSSESVVNIDTRKNTTDFIATATPAELTARVNQIMSSSLPHGG